MKKQIRYGFSALFALLLTACGGGGDEEDIVMRYPISLNVGVSTRVTDTQFETNDQVGLYVVNYQQNQPGVLQKTGNHVDNKKFTYQSKWVPENVVYWLDDKTPADFYCYYPYGSPANVNAYSFSIQRNQTSEANYKKSEFLWGKAVKKYPSENPVNLSLNHLMSCALVKVKPGSGFSEDALKAAKIAVRLNDAKAEMVVDLSNGNLSAAGKEGSIEFYPTGIDHEFKALVVPQSISADRFITVTIDGKEYNLKKDFTFISGKRHTFTVTVRRTSSGINVDINNWVDDGTDNGGIAE